jgi:hypothetical protein
MVISSHPTKNRRLLTLTMSGMLLCLPSVSPNLFDAPQKYLPAFTSKEYANKSEMDIHG